MKDSVISRHGLKYLTVASPKTIKGEARQFVTAILYLAPADLSGFNVCPMATQGCKSACLNTAGRGAMSKIQTARVNKTLAYFKDRKAFMAHLVSDLETIQARAHAKGFKVAARLNGTSDILWHRVPVWRHGREHASIHAAFPGVQFYEYTKQGRAKFSACPPNLHVTFSRSETNEDEARKLAKAGFNVAVVFDTLPATHWGMPVYNADQDDLRFLDPAGHVAGLVAKGRAKSDQSGFVVRNAG